MIDGNALLRRQIALIMLPVAAVSFILITINFAQLTRMLLARTRDQADVVALQAAAAVETALVSAPDQLPESAISESPTARELIESAVRRGGSGPITFLSIESLDGTQLLRAPRGTKTLPLPQLLTLLESSGSRRLQLIFPPSPLDYEYSRALTYRNQELGRVRLGVSLRSLRREIMQSFLTTFLIALAAVAVATVVAISSTRLLIAPLRAISSSIDLLEQRELPTPHDGATAERSRGIEVELVTDRIAQLGRQIAGDRSELREARGQLQQILSNLQERLLLVNADCRVMLASPGIEELLGVPKIRVAEGDALSEIIGLNHPLVALTKRSLSTRETAERVTLPAVNGHAARTVLVTVQPITDLGQSIGALISLRDREKVNQLETQLNYAERLADFTRIMSGIAHEVKNPLNAMVIHIELLRAKLERSRTLDDEDYRPQLHILTSEIQRLDRVVQTFLNFTRPTRISPRVLDVNRLIEETLALAAPEAHKRGATVRSSFDRNLAPIAGDPDVLKQAFLNVIINGFQAMEDGGVLSISTARDGERAVCISFTDHGDGIPVETRSRVFQLYFTTKPDGNGIGLAQAFRAVQLHNGQIKFESETGVGTTFYIRLPVV